MGFYRTFRITCQGVHLCGEAKGFKPGAVAKATCPQFMRGVVLKRLESHECDPNPLDLFASRMKSFFKTVEVRRGSACKRSYNL